MPGRRETPIVKIERREPNVDDVTWAHLRLPPFPQVALRVLQLANKENVQLHQMSDLISSDMAFASEVLTIANSLLYAPRFPASSILQAIAVLGINNLQGMCLTVAARTYMGKALNLSSIQVIWRHNLACALIAEQMAAAGFMDKDIAYTSGILHDIGRLALATVRPKEYSALLGTHGGSGVSILQAERDMFGADHCGIGHQLIVDWKLPSEFDAVVFEHHSPRRPDGSWSVAELIKVSCRMADTAGFPAFLGCEAAPYADLLAELPARECRLFPLEVETLASDVANRIQAIGSV
ncbi:MAG: HDOD domain-containing protein [Terracidiphilus sp.]